MSIPIPRFRGNAIEKDGRWEWEMIMSFIGDGDNGVWICSKKSYIIKEKAIKAMMDAIREITDKITEEIGDGVKIKEYIDMKTNDIRSFDKSDEH